MHRSRISTKGLGLAAAGIALTFAFNAPAQAAPRWIAKITSTAQTGHPTVEGIERLAALVKERTNGELEIRVFPNSQLGGEAESLEGMKLGSIQGGLITSSLFSQWVPDFEIIDLPFVFRDDAHAQKACATVFQETLAPKLAAHGFRALGCFNFGGRHLISTFPITQLSDIRGKKMRVIQSPLHVKMWQAAGANPTPVPAPEVYSALQTRVVDFMDNPMTTYLSFKWYEVAKHFTILGHVNSIQFITFSEDWFKKLPEATQAILRKAVDETMPWTYDKLREQEKASLQKTVDAGSTVHQVTDRAAWESAMASMLKDFTAKVPDGQQAIDRLKALN